MNIDAILNDLEEAERTWKTARNAMAEASSRRSALIQEALAAGIPQAVIGRLLGVSRQRIHQLTGSDLPENRKVGGTMGSFVDKHDGPESEQERREDEKYHEGYYEQI